MTSNQIPHSLIWNSANCRLYLEPSRPHDEKLELQTLHDRLLSFTHEETKYYEEFTEVERLGPAIPDFILLRYYNLYRMTSKVAYFEDRLTKGGGNTVSEFDQEILTKLLSDHGAYIPSMYSHNGMWNGQIVEQLVLCETTNTLPLTSSHRHLAATIETVHSNIIYYPKYMAGLRWNWITSPPAQVTETCHSQRT
jgi:hypothetical protein